MVPFSIALINQASCAADLKQFFSQYSQVFFYCCVPMNTSLPLPACTHHPFWLGASPCVAFISIAFHFFLWFFFLFWFHAMVIFRCFCKLGKPCNYFDTRVSNSIHELILEMYRFIFVSLWEKLQDMPVTSAMTSWGWWMHDKKKCRRRWIVVFLYVDGA